MRVFQALKDFESTETKSVYCAGLTYTVQNNRMLEALAEVWALEGKVKWLHAPEKLGMVSGTGTVTDPEDDPWYVRMWRWLWL